MTSSALENLLTRNASQPYNPRTKTLNAVTVASSSYTDNGKFYFQRVLNFFMQANKQAYYLLCK